MLTLLGSLALTALPALAPADGAHWYADYDQALAVAVEQKKDLLVDFTGSDWCGWCIRLHDEVFQHAAFYEAIQKEYVLVALDFPNSEEAKAKVPNPERNQELMEKYAVQGFPTILLMTTDGQVYGETGYQRGGPEAYVKHLGEIATSGRKTIAAVRELTAEYAAAEDDDGRVAVLGKVFAFLTENKGAPRLMGPLVDLATNAFTLDADNSRGLKRQAVEVLLSQEIWNPQVAAAARQVDPKNEGGLVERALEVQISSVQDDATAGALTKDLLAFLGEGLAIQNKTQMALFAAQAANWNAEPALLDNAAAARELAEHSLRLDPEGRAADSMRDLLEKLTVQ